MSRPFKTFLADDEDGWANLIHGVNVGDKSSADLGNQDV